MHLPFPGLLSRAAPTQWTVALLPWLPERPSLQTRGCHLLNVHGLGLAKLFLCPIKTPLRFAYSINWLRDKFCLTRIVLPRVTVAKPEKGMSLLLSVWSLDRQHRLHLGKGFLNLSTVDICSQETLWWNHPVYQTLPSRCKNVPRSPRPTVSPVKATVQGLVGDVGSPDLPRARESESALQQDLG